MANVTMPTARDVANVCLAAVAAPAVVAWWVESLTQVLIVAVVAELAAVTLGLPLLAWLRRTHSQLVSSLVAAGAAGCVAGGLVVALVLLAISVDRFFARDADTLAIITVGALAGAGLGLASGFALCALQQSGDSQRT